MVLSAASKPLATCMALIKAEGGVAMTQFATNIKGSCLRSAALNKISLMTLGQASASIQICRGMFFYFLVI
jgi:hypothetical protein